MPNTAVLQLATPSLLSTSPDMAANGMMGPPLYGVLWPDWIKWAGIPGSLFSLLPHEQDEASQGLVTKHSVTVITVGM